jgi:hypothetical protein
VEIGALVRGADHGDDEVGVLPDLLVADRRLEQVRVLVDPAPEVERQGVARGQVGVTMGSGYSTPEPDRNCVATARLSRHGE